MSGVQWNLRRETNLGPGNFALVWRLVSLRGQPILQLKCHSFILLQVFQKIFDITYKT